MASNYGLSSGNIHAVFPGQGSQTVGMAQFIFDQFPKLRPIFEEADDTLKFHLSKLCFEGPDEKLQLTENTQPALFLCSYVIFQALRQEFGFSPKLFLGHSLGEYSALACAGGLDFSTTLSLVRLRGQAMQSAVPQGIGGMAAILGPDQDRVSEICIWIKKQNPKWVLEIANINAPGQIVVSGHLEAVQFLAKPETALKLSTDLSATFRMKVIPLKVSAPFHCSLMAPAQIVMAEALKNTKILDLPMGTCIVQNATASAESNADRLRENLIQQVTLPVRWTESIQVAQSLGLKIVIEVGSGQVLAGLLKKIDSTGLRTFNVGDMNQFKAVGSLQEDRIQ